MIPFCVYIRKLLNVWPSQEVLHFPFLYIIHLSLFNHFTLPSFLSPFSFCIKLIFSTYTTKSLPRSHLRRSLFRIPIIRSLICRVLYTSYCLSIPIINLRFRSAVRPLHLSSYLRHTCWPKIFPGIPGRIGMKCRRTHTLSPSLHLDRIPCAVIRTQMFTSVPMASYVPKPT